MLSFSLRLYGISSGFFRYISDYFNKKTIILSDPKSVPGTAEWACNRLVPLNPGTT